LLFIVPFRFSKYYTGKGFLACSIRWKYIDMLGFMIIWLDPMCDDYDEIASIIL